MMRFLLSLLVKYNWIAFLLIIGFLIQSIKKEKTKRHDLLEYRKVNQQELERWKNKAGESYAKTKALEIEARNVKLVLGKKKVSELKKEVGNVKKNLISYQKVEITASGRVSTSLSDVQDSTNRVTNFSIKSIDFFDPFFAMSGSYNLLNDSLIVNYQAKNTFEIFHYYERPGKPPFNVFRRKHAVVKVKFENPESTVDSMTTIILQRKK